jgi:hypothetical protein
LAALVVQPLAGGIECRAHGFGGVVVKGGARLPNERQKRHGNLLEGSTLAPISGLDLPDGSGIELREDLQQQNQRARFEYFLTVQRWPAFY